MDEPPIISMRQEDIDAELAKRPSNQRSDGKNRPYTRRRKLSWTRLIQIYREIHSPAGATARGRQAIRARHGLDNNQLHTIRRATTLKMRHVLAFYGEVSREEALANPATLAMRRE